MYKGVNMTDDFKELIKDVQGLPIEEWKIKYPNFHSWLENNGFVYNKAKDRTIKRK